MADDPRKKGRDSKTVSQQPHEQAYQRRKVKNSNSSSSERSTRGSESSRSGNRSGSTGDRSGSNGGR